MLSKQSHKYKIPKEKTHVDLLAFAANKSIAIRRSSMRGGSICRARNLLMHPYSWWECSTTRANRMPPDYTEPKKNVKPKNRLYKSTTWKSCSINKLSLFRLTFFLLFIIQTMNLIIPLLFLLLASSEYHEIGNGKKNPRSKSMMKTLPFQILQVHKIIIKDPWISRGVDALS